MEEARQKFETFRAVVHPWLCDVMGHMATRHYSPMFEDASYHLFTMMGVESDKENDFGWADVRQEIDYLEEINLGDLLVLQSFPSRLGSKSVTYVHEMLHAETGALKARMTTTSVRFDLKARRAVPIEGALRQRIESRLMQASS